LHLRTTGNFRIRNPLFSNGICFHVSNLGSFTLFSFLVTQLAEVKQSVSVNSVVYNYCFTNCFHFFCCRLFVCNIRKQASSMTNLMHTCFILQYVHYNPLHVSSITCSSPGRWIVLMQHLVPSLSFSGHPVHLCTGWPLIEREDTRCCINTIQRPDDEHIMLETCTGLQKNLL
jgi:hypothetical protein